MVGEEENQLATWLEQDDTGSISMLLLPSFALRGRLTEGSIGGILYHAGYINC